MIISIVYSKRSIALAVAAIASIGIVVALLTSHVLTIDHYFGTYGFSIGSNNTYCSVEDKLPVFTCEHVR